MKDFKKALFLDRDGILNLDKGYVYLFNDITWVDGIFELIHFANTHNYLVIVLTNQSGVAHGMYKEEDILILHNQMNAFLRSKNLRIDDWYYCIESESNRRKPRPGMMIEARDKYNIDLSKSFMVGDKVTDIIEIEGPKIFLLRGNYSLVEVEKNKKAEIFDTLDEILLKLKQNQK